MQAVIDYDEYILVLLETDILWKLAPSHKNISKKYIFPCQN